MFCIRPLVVYSHENNTDMNINAYNIVKKVGINNIKKEKKNAVIKVEKNPMIK